MKIIVVFFSRTGTTRKVGEMIAEKFGADTEEIKDTVDRSGVKGYLLSGRDAMRKRLTKLEPLKHNLAEYDLVVIGTPVWGWTVSVPMRTFVTEQKGIIKKTAFFCTMGGSGAERAFSEMEKIIGKKPAGTLALTTKEVVAGNFSEKVEKFLSGLNKVK